MATRKPIVYIDGYPGELDVTSDRLNLPFIFRAGTAPTAEEADIWYDTTAGILKMWNMFKLRLRVQECLKVIGGTTQRRQALVCI